jgi:hypothetical protein
MKKCLAFSILLNSVLLGGMICFLSNRQKEKTVSLPLLPQVQPQVSVMATSVSSSPTGAPTGSFCWTQLMSAKDYGRFIANLRAIGCPEATVEDIVRGDTRRVFARERSQLALDDSGSGPWSPQAEQQLVADLLGQPESPGKSQNTENRKYLNNPEMATGVSGPSPDAQSGTANYPLFMQNVNWSALGFTADQQVVIAQVRQQFQSEMKGVGPASDTANPNPTAGVRGSTSLTTGPGDAAAPTRGQTALQGAEDQLQALLGAQGYATYQQQKYYAWYQPQVLANADGANLNINPDAFPAR